MVGLGVDLGRGERCDRICGTTACLQSRDVSDEPSDDAIYCSHLRACSRDTLLDRRDRGRRRHDRRSRDVRPPGIRRGLTFIYILVSIYCIDDRVCGHLVRGEREDVQGVRIERGAPSIGSGHRPGGERYAPDGRTSLRKSTPTNVLDDAVDHSCRFRGQRDIACRVCPGGAIESSDIDDGQSLVEFSRRGGVSPDVRARSVGIRRVRRDRHRIQSVASRVDVVRLGPSCVSRAEALGPARRGFLSHPVPDYRRTVRASGSSGSPRRGRRWSHLVSILQREAPWGALIYEHKRESVPRFL